MISHENVRKQAELLKDEKVAVLFSGGKDAIAATDLWLRYHPKNNIFFYFFFVAGLSFVESILCAYEHRWNIEIRRLPCAVSCGLLAARGGWRKKTWTNADVEKRALEQAGLTWAVTGIKRSDSFHRRGMLKNTEYGIQTEAHKVHPVIDFSDREVKVYVQTNDLPLSPTYDMGLNRSMWVPTPQGMLWVKEHYPMDYKRIMAVFPELENSMFRLQERLSRE